MLFRKKQCPIDLEKGKSLYYEYNGNRFGMWHELGDEYENCNVPEKIENEWKKDIINKLEKRISTAQGFDLEYAVSSYLRLSKAGYKWLIRLLQTRKMDTFTAIIFCEKLKDMARASLIKRIVIRRFLKNFKAKLLSQPITIHETYKNAYMNNYDFSDGNIIKRINAI